ncbi:MAG: 50S ribosomal protein L5 [Phycisphaerae bacterium]|nr:50S ribosomal protein L5 [Phycisphaerae bacterium]
MARLLERYKTQISPTLREEFSCSTLMAVPALKKVVVSMGVGRALAEKKRLEIAAAELALITGQKPLVCKATKSVASFKLREGNEIGLKVTLRGRRMFEFVDRLINAAIPRMRDFRGLNPKSFDGRGNYNMGLTEQTVFPEIDAAKTEFQQGMNITFVTTTESDEQARRLLRLLGMPFRTE